MADRPSFPPDKGPSNTQSGIHTPAGYNGKPGSAGDRKAPVKHYPSTDAMVPKSANVIAGPGKSKTGPGGEGSPSR